MTTNRTLAQTLAVQSQVHLPGTVGRLLKQIRDLERVAPLFVKAGLVHGVERPNPIDTRASGIATHSATTKTIGGFLYGAAAARCDLLVEHNAVSTAGQDSACEIDDINYENQSMRLALAAMRQAYELADRAVVEGRSRLIFLDTALVMDRSMVPPASRAGEPGYPAAYAATRRPSSRSGRATESGSSRGTRAGQSSSVSLRSASARSSSRRSKTCGFRTGAARSCRPRRSTARRSRPSTACARRSSASASGASCTASSAASRGPPRSA
jgi:hypothetical protein